MIVLKVLLVPVPFAEWKGKEMSHLQSHYHYCMNNWKAENWTYMATESLVLELVLQEDQQHRDSDA